MEACQAQCDITWKNGNVTTLLFDGSTNALAEAHVFKFIQEWIDAPRDQHTLTTYNEENLSGAYLISEILAIEHVLTYA